MNCTTIYVRRFAWLLVLVAACGCRSFTLPGIPLASSLKLAREPAVPKELASRVGPTSDERIEQVQQLGRSAKRGAPAEHAQIAETLVRQVQNEDDPRVRREIIKAISQCQTPSAAAVLRAGLNDEDTDVRVACCEAWGRGGGPESVMMLRQALESDAEADVRLAAVRALGESKQPGIVEALAVALQPTQDPALQYRAVQALKDATGLDYGNDLVAWRNYAAQQTARGSASAPIVAGGGPVQRALSWWR